MKIEKLLETNRVAGVPTYKVEATLEGVSLQTSRRSVNEGGVWVEKRTLTLTTLGKLQEGDRIRVSRVEKTRSGSVKVREHYNVAYDMTGFSRMGKYEVEKVPADE